MSITLHSRVLLSGTALSSGITNIGTFSMTTGGKGGTSLTNVSIITVARAVVRLSTGHQGHISILGLFSNFGGSLNTFSTNNLHEVVSAGDGGFSNSDLLYQASGSNLDIAFLLTVGGVTADVSGTMDIWVRP